MVVLVMDKTQVMKTKQQGLMTPVVAVAAVMVLTLEQMVVPVQYS